MNEKRLFYIIGLPSLILIFFFSIVFFMVNTMMIVTSALVLFFAIVHGKLKDHPYIRTSKFSFVVLLICCGSFIGLFAPQVWGNQFATNLHKADLIEPDHYIIESLADKFEDWVENDKPEIDKYHGWVIGYTNYSEIPFQYDECERYNYELNLSESSFDELTFTQQMYVINYFIKYMIMDYEYDSVVYGSSEYKATVEQILTTGYNSGWTEKSQDDCDGIAVVTVSLLQNLGYNAYIGSGKSHWFSVVEPQEGDGWYRPVILNSWADIHLFYYFNQNEFKLGQPLLDTFKDTWFLDEIPSELEMIMDMAGGNYLIFIVIALVVSIIGVMFICFPRSHDESLSAQITESRKKRLEKLEKIKFLGNRKNPLYWLIKGTYVRVGNPFARMYLKYWIDVIWVTITLFCVIVGIFNLNLIYWLFSYFAFTLWLIIFTLDNQYVNKGLEVLVRKVKTRKDL